MSLNDSHNRRIHDGSIAKASKRHKVNPHITHNRKLDNSMRMENIEHDVVFNTQILYEVLETNKRYSVYLEAQIKKEDAAANFWADIRKQTASAGIFGIVGLIFTGLWFAFKAYIGKV